MLRARSVVHHLRGHRWPGFHRFERRPRTGWPRATVRIIDALVEGHGGDRRNVDGLDVEIVEAEIGDAVSPMLSPMPTSSSTSPAKSVTSGIDARTAARSACQRGHPRRRSSRSFVASIRRLASCTPRHDRCTADHCDHRSTSCTRPARWMSTASPSWPASNCTSCTTPPTTCRRPACG